MSASYRIYRTFEGRYYVELRSGTGRVMLCTEERSTLALARASVSSLRFICDSHVEDVHGVTGENTDELSYPKFRIDRRGRGVYTVCVCARNGKCVARTPDLATTGAVSEILADIRRTARHAPTEEKIVDLYE